MHWCIHFSPIPHGLNLQPLGVSIQVLLDIRIYVSCMKTKKSKNVLDLNSVQVHRFLAVHLKQEVHKI
jgi:hypothetical protein